MELVWHFLAHDVELRSRRDAETLQGLSADTLSLIDTIEADRNYAAVTGPHCDRCPYRAICPAWGAPPAQLSFDWAS